MWELQEQEAIKAGCSCSRVVCGEPSKHSCTCGQSRSTSRSLTGMGLFFEKFHKQTRNKLGPNALVPVTYPSSSPPDLTVEKTGAHSVHYSVLCLRNFRLSPPVTSFLHETSPLPAPPFLFPLHLFSVVSLILDYLLKLSSLVCWDLHGITFFKIKTYFM